jgi:hypothetical protein
MFPVAAMIAQQIAKQVATQAVKQIVQQMVQQLVQKLVQQMVGQMIQQMVQQLAQQMGVSPGEANKTAQSMMEQLGIEGGNQGSIRETLNEASQQLGLSPQQQGEMTRSVEDFVNESLRQGVKDAMEGANVENKGRKNGGRASKGDFFTLLAEILGKKINSGFNDMKNLADATNWKDPKQATDFQAQQQKFGYFMQSLSTALKTVGEALANVARKQ